MKRADRPETLVCSGRPRATVLSGAIKDLNLSRHLGYFCSWFVSGSELLELSPEELGSSTAELEGLIQKTRSLAEKKLKTYNPYEVSVYFERFKLTDVGGEPFFSLQDVGCIEGKSITDLAADAINESRRLGYICGERAIYRALASKHGFNAFGTTLEEVTELFWVRDTLKNNLTAIAAKTRSNALSFSFDYLMLLSDFSKKSLSELGWSKQAFIDAFGKDRTRELRQTIPYLRGLVRR